MGSFLDKTRTADPKPVSEARRKIAAALATLPQNQATQPARVPDCAIVELSCVCAVYDQPYTLRFRRQPDGLLRFLESVKGEQTQHNAPGGRLGLVLELSVIAFENRVRPCAWCGDGSFHHCATHCGALVCGGLIRSDTFHCRKSCGASWVGVPLAKVEGRIAEQAPQTPMSPRPPAPAQHGERLLLAAGRSMVKSSALGSGDQNH
jgi:hypothetical protein